MPQIALVKILAFLLISQVQINPGTLIQDNYYPSGNKDADKVYDSDRPAKKYPLLKLDVAAYDPEFNKIEPGIYSVEYSPESNVLLIKDGAKIIKAPVFQVIKSNNKLEYQSKKKKKKNTSVTNVQTFIPSAKVTFIKDLKVFIIYRNGNLEVQSFLYLPEAVLQGN